jgi:uncharacterized membrane protein YfcA
MTALVVAVLLSVAIGIALGLLGGGGSILTVPILVYALGMEEKSAIASSLLVVGVTSAVAAIQHARAKNIVWSVALVFALAGMLGAYVGGRMAAFIPATILLVLFAVMMLATALAMWRGRRRDPSDDADDDDDVAERPRSAPARRFATALIAVEGLAVGVVTGLVGAGGGFLVVPALALLGRLTMRQAIGSSLVVIALKSFAGYAGYASHVAIDWRMTGVVALAAVAGTFIGAPLAKRVPQETLRRGFAVFVVAMALLLLVKQL